MKGILLAGGSGSRLFPLTKFTNKQMLPIYDKPMIYYPLSVLMLSGIKNILIICNPEDLNLFQTTLGDGKSFGIKLSYKVQVKPNGIAEAFIIAEEFIGHDTVSLILGDNLFFGHGFSDILKRSKELKKGGIVFAYRVKDPKRFGIIEVDKSGAIRSIEEKPKNPISNFAVTGLYFYDNKVISMAKSLRPSLRGELEITQINNNYLKDGTLNVEILGRGFAWLDMGTHDSLLEASSFVSTIEKRQGFKIACLEEIAWSQGWINEEELLFHAKHYENSAYGYYLTELVENNKHIR